MTELKRDNTSELIISFETNPGKKKVQNKANLGPALLKSHSLSIKIKDADLISEEDDFEGEDDHMHTISVCEESNSYFSNHPHNFDEMGSYAGKPRTAKKYNRKEKSLGELCKKFIYLYGSHDYCIIALDECTQTLGVERRRIYDIINILESFNVLSRLAKNQYEWRGVSQIQVSISKMKSMDENDEFACPTNKRKKKKKSLGILCESFIKQFLTWRSKISLEQAARRISDGQIEDSKLKTKVRRLYDIANVLAALNLIKKSSLDTRKPAFEWVGESGLMHFMDEMDQHFEKHPTKTTSIIKSGSFTQQVEQVKVSNLNDIHNSKISSGYQKSGCENEDTFNPYSGATKETAEESKSGSPREKNSGTELSSELAELLERLSLNPFTHPVYKPTPIYPINHFLTNPCSVSSTIN